MSQRGGDGQLASKHCVLYCQLSSAQMTGFHQSRGHALCGRSTLKEKSTFPHKKK